MDSKILDLFLFCQRGKGKTEEEGAAALQYLQKIEEELLPLLGEEGKKLVKSYRWAITEYLQELEYFQQIRVMNAGIKIGMEIRQAFFEDEA